MGCAGCVRTVDFVEPLRARLRVGAWIVFASVLVSRPHCWCGWCLDDLISCRRVFQCKWHGPVAPFFCGVGGFVAMGVWWMPWQAVPMKDVWGRDRPRGAADRALIRGCPNGVTRRLLWAGTASVLRGVRREVKHLSTCRKGYSVSSGERKRMMAKPVPCDTRRGLRHRCRGSGRAGADAPAASIENRV